MEFTAIKTMAFWLLQMPALQDDFGFNVRPMSEKKLLKCTALQFRHGKWKWNSQILLNEHYHHVQFHIN